MKAQDILAVDVVVEHGREYIVGSHSYSLHVALAEKYGGDMEWSPTMLCRAEAATVPPSAPSLARSSLCEQQP